MGGLDVCASQLSAPFLHDQIVGLIVFGVSLMTRLRRVDVAFARGYLVLERVLPTAGLLVDDVI